jgi:CPA1 family monovalent cation:H+ antiporter
MLVVPLVAIAHRANVSYPIVLVLGGLALSFVPDLPKVRMDPDVVFLIFLPPLLYWQSITAPTEFIIKNAGQVGVLAIGLVVATTVAVALIAHAIIPFMPWSAAFVLGAIVSPTDELAAVPVLEHFRLPRHIAAIISGESLLNDASALVIYAVAIGAAATGAFDPTETLVRFAVSVFGSLLIGCGTGWIAVALWRHIKDRQLQSVVSVTLPFLSYLPASHFGLSGVLAVVAAGSYANHFTPRALTPATRVQVRGFWNTLVFVANAVLFLVVGLQLHDVASAVFDRESWPAVIGYAVAVNATILIIRFALVMLAEYSPTAGPPDRSAPNWRNAIVVAWSGLRGAVSLAAALAIPLSLPSGAPFPHRDLIVFITFTVILFTLVAGGLSLPTIVRLARIEGGNEEAAELRLALIRSYDAAIAKVGELEHEGRLDNARAQTLRRELQHRRQAQRLAEDEAGVHLHDMHNDADRELTFAQRNAVIEMRERGEIDNIVMLRVLASLDLAATRSALIIENS